MIIEIIESISPKYAVEKIQDIYYIYNKQIIQEDIIQARLIAKASLKETTLLIYPVNQSEKMVIELKRPIIIDLMDPTSIDEIRKALANCQNYFANPDHLYSAKFSRRYFQDFTCK